MFIPLVIFYFKGGCGVNQINLQTLLYKGSYTVDLHMCGINTEQLRKTVFIKKKKIQVKQI